MQKIKNTIFKVYLGLIIVYTIAADPPESAEKHNPGHRLMRKNLPETSPRAVRGSDSGMSKT